MNSNEQTTLSSRTQLLIPTTIATKRMQRYRLSNSSNSSRTPDQLRIRESVKHILALSRLVVERGRAIPILRVPPGAISAARPPRMNFSRRALAFLVPDLPWSKVEPPRYLGTCGEQRCGDLARMSARLLQMKKTGGGDVRCYFVCARVRVTAFRGR